MVRKKEGDNVHAARRPPVPHLCKSLKAYIIRAMELALMCDQIVLLHVHDPLTSKTIVYASDPKLLEG